MEINLTSRITQIFDTIEKWTSSNPVLLKGEVALVDMGDNTIQIRVGNGTTHFVDLPASLYVDYANKLRYTVNGSIVEINPEDITTHEFLESKGFIQSSTLEDMEEPINALDATLLAGRPASEYVTLSQLRTIAVINEENNTIESIDGEKICNSVSEDCLPKSVFTKCIVVLNDAERFALTSASVQSGDTVKVISSNKMYFVKDTSHLNIEDGYEEYTVGTAANVSWSGITDKPEILTKDETENAIRNMENDIDNIEECVTSKAQVQIITWGADD